MSEIKKPNYLVLILLSGLVVRLLFLLFGAELYYGRPDFFIDADLDSYRRPILNLIETGTYTARAGHEYGPFLRTPGYPFLFGLFYLLSGKELELTYQLLIWFQTLIDCLGIFLIYKIVMAVRKDIFQAYVAAFLYATYPFVIAWTTVVYAETLSIIVLLISIYFALARSDKHHWFYAGLFAGLDVLIRPQTGLLMLSFGIAILLTINHRETLIKNLIQKIQKVLIPLSLGFLLVYAPWPIRNYVNHDKVMLFHDYRCGKEWHEDFTTFWGYIFSVKSEWEPQFSSIIHNETSVFPREAYVVAGDSAKLARAMFLAKHCGSSFSHRTGYWKEKIADNEPNCNAEISSLFTELRANQIKYNSWNYHVMIPLHNLKKALFKSQLYDQSTLLRKMASLLFYYRTLLILLGIWGLVWCIRRWKRPDLDQKEKILSATVLLYTILWYFYMAYFHRNIEIRYFLPADVLLLITASIPIRSFINFIQERWAKNG